MSGTEMKRIRDNLGWSRQRMGDRVGKNAATIWRYENGQLEIPKAIAELVKLLESFKAA